MSRLTRELSRAEQWGIFLVMSDKWYYYKYAYQGHILLLRKLSLSLSLPVLMHGGLLRTAFCLSVTKNNSLDKNLYQNKDPKQRQVGSQQRKVALFFYVQTKQ